MSHLFGQRTAKLYLQSSSFDTTKSGSEAGYLFF